MKNLLTISIFLFSQALPAQIVASKGDVEEFNFFYSDTANGEFAFGDYEPKDIIQLNDGSYLIGTQLSISFPSQYKSPENYDSAYFAKSKVFQEKSHNSSGTVLKLNSNFEKEWETTCRGQRIEKILKTSDNRILILGEDVSMKFVWLAEIDQNGNIKWEKHFNYKNIVSIADALIDQNDEVYFLLEAENTIPIRSIRNAGKRRIRLFRAAGSNTHLALLKVSSFGKKKWIKSIEKRNKCGIFGYNLINHQDSIFASYANSVSECEGKYVTDISTSTKKSRTHEIPDQVMVSYKSGLITITSYSEGKLELYKSGVLIDTISVVSANKDVRIEKAITEPFGSLIIGSNYDNNMDYLLINLGPDLKFRGYWTYPRDEYNEIRGALILDNGDTLIVGKCYREKRGTSNKLTTFINLIKIKNGV